LSIDERILHFLTGVDDVDERLADIARPVAAVDALPPSHNAVARRIAETWARTMEHGDPPVVQLCGSDAAAKQAVASAACGYLGMSVLALPMRAIPSPGHEAATLVRLCEREALLSDRVVLLDCDDVGEGEPHRDAATDHFIETIRTPLIVSLPERRPTPRRPTLTIDVERPTVVEQRALWHESLGIEREAFPALDDEIDGLVAQFHVNLPTIRGVCAEAMGTLAAGTDNGGDASPDAPAVGRALWQSCRRQARPRLDDLAQRIEPGAGWDDLVLPEAQRRTLWEIAVHVRRRATVYERWGFARRNERGLGITALFSGSSGTGKTMAAEVLAADLMLDLYRIDLSAVVSKYIGETEKNLRRVFDTAEQGGAILLFDEADALFGKRSDVKDSHDRFANIEVSYLLQRMEAYRGLAILTTNLKESLDKAFVRRLRFIVEFPFPDAGLRADIWRHAFPPETPTEGLDPARLGRLNVAGGNIRNIALAAAFLAAEDGSSVTMAHLLRAARGEYEKLGRQITDSEVRGWS
jgi:hypothetical protein